MQTLVRVSYPATDFPSCKVGRIRIRMFVDNRAVFLKLEVITSSENSCFLVNSAILWLKRHNINKGWLE